MTNTQTKIARLRSRVERIEKALVSLAAIADPNAGCDAPICYEEWRKLKAICGQIRIEALSAAPERPTTSTTDVG